MSSRLIPIVIDPLDDELLYSYLLRLMFANCIHKSVFYDMLGMNVLDVHFNVRSDSMDYLLPFLTETAPGNELGFFYNHTIFPALFPLLSEYDAQSIVARCFHHLPKGLPAFIHKADYLTVLKECPECTKENPGRLPLRSNSIPVLYRSHQMPGVTVCHKHKCTLQEINIKYQATRPLGVFPYSHDYAVFSHDFLNANYRVDCHMIRNVTIQYIKEQTGKTELTDEEALCFVQDLAAKTGVYNSFPSSFFKSSILANPRSPEISLMILFLVFGSVAKLSQTICKYTDISENDLHAGYVRKAPCSCGKQHYIPLSDSPFFPVCDEKCQTLTPQEYLERLVKDAAGPDYEIGSIDYEKGHVSLIDNESRKECDYPVSRVFSSYKNIRSKSSKKTKASKYDLLKRRILKSQKFIPEDNIPTDDENIWIKCKDCGTTFLYAEMPNLKSCPECKRIERENIIRKEIENVTKGQFFLAGKYTAKYEKIDIGCSQCGSIRRTLYHNFLYHGLCSCKNCGNVCRWER